MHLLDSALPDFRAGYKAREKRTRGRGGGFGGVRGKERKIRRQETGREVIPATSRTWFDSSLRHHELQASEAECCRQSARLTFVCLARETA